MAAKDPNILTLFKVFAGDSRTSGLVLPSSEKRKEIEKLRSDETRGLYLNDFI